VPAEEEDEREAEYVAEGVPAAEGDDDDELLAKAEAEGTGAGCAQSPPRWRSTSHWTTPGATGRTHQPACGWGCWWMCPPRRARPMGCRWTRATARQLQVFRRAR
jgi:hypothetical protein